MSFISLFVGVIDLDLPSLLAGHAQQLRILLVSRLPRLPAVLCTGVGMSVAGLIMQQLCMNKFVSPHHGRDHHGRIVCLAHPAVWYTAGDGVSALDMMLADPESALLW